MRIAINASFSEKLSLLVVVFLVQVISASGQNCNVSFPGTATRNFSTACGSSPNDLRLGEGFRMDDGDTFTFDISADLSDVSVKARGNAKIIIPAGVTVNVDGHFHLDQEDSGCSVSNPCVFEIVVNGTLIISQHLKNDLFTVVWSGTGTVVVEDKLDNSKNACMSCGTGGCPNFTAVSDCSDDGNNCSGGDFCAAIANTCSSDILKPIITGCPANIVTNVTGSGCTRVVSWTKPVAVDNCTLISFTANYQPGAAFPKGVHTVTYTALDASGNSETCSFTVTVNDPVKPVILNCTPIVIISSYDPILQTGIATWEIPKATDNCTTVSLISSAEPGDNFEKGITMVTYTATDASGNITTCNFNVNMMEGTPEVQLEVYKALSPNNDGLNDVWHIKGIDKYPDNKVTVFDRWGREVYNAKGYNNTTVVWDGMTGGKALPAGTYFYSVEISNEAAILRGPLELVN